MNVLDGRVAIITGASRGIGAVIAEAFASAGAVAVVVARDRPLLDEVVTSIESGGGRARAIVADVTSATDMQGVVDDVMTAHGRLDFAVNNANESPRPAPLAEIDAEQFERSIATSILGTFHGMRAQIPAMLATLDSKSGARPVIVNMASVAGVTALPGLSPYVAGKAGIIAMTKVAALDYASRGIRINALAPGPTATPAMVALPPESLRRTVSSVPMRRMVEMGEVADAVLWMCSAASSFVTGVVLPIDGGLSVGHG